MRHYLTMFGYACKFAFHALKRNWLLALSAIASIGLSLLLIGLVDSVGITVDHFATNAQNKVAIHVVMDENLSKFEQEALKTKIENLDGVEQVVFSSKDEELEIMIREKGDSYAIYRGKDNPLNDAFFVYLNEGASLSDLHREIDNMDGVYQSAFGGSSASRFLKAIRIGRVIGWVVVVLLLLLCSYLIYNTVKTTVDTRADEIAIMRQVGATDKFVIVPFVIEGAVIGLVSSLISYLLLVWAYSSFYKASGGRLFANVFSLVKPSIYDLRLGLLILFAGFGLGILASLFAVKRYLKEIR